MLPALPTGIASASGAAPSSSQTSKAAVFWPSIRYGLIEFTSSTGWRSTISLTSSSAWSKLPRNEITRAPCMTAWASLPRAILPSGTITAPRRPARAAYAAVLAAVLPVEAQITASAPFPFARETARVMPRSLKLPVGFIPSNLRCVSTPIRSDRRGACTSGVEPSIRVTIGSPGSSGRRSR